jgi:hypothetical protein
LLSGTSHANLKDVGVGVFLWIDLVFLWGDLVPLWGIDFPRLLTSFPCGDLVPPPFDLVPLWGKFVPLPSDLVFPRMQIKRTPDGVLFGF